MFQNLFRRQTPSPRPVAVSASTPRNRAELGMSPHYPPKDFSSYGDLAGAVEAVPVEVLVDVTRDALDVLQHETGFHRDEFEKIVMPMVRRYYRMVHLLPASANHHHARLGGLAVHGIDVAARAARATHNAVLDFDPVYMRDLELRAKRRMLWPLAAACAGLCHDLGKVLIDQMVTDVADGDLWNPVTEPLMDWVERKHVKRYAIRYRDGDRFHRHEAFSLLLFGSVVGRDIMGFISGLGRDVLEAVLMSVLGSDATEKISAMVAKADHDSTAADREATQSIWKEGGAASDPVLNRLLEAGNRLLRQREWRTNAPGHPVIACQDGIFLVWPQAFQMMLRDARDTGKSTGIPAEPTEVAEMFVRAGIATPRILSDGTRRVLWPILLNTGASVETPSGDASTGFGDMVAQFDRSRSALLLRNPEFLFSGVPAPDLVSVSVAPDPTLAVVVPVDTPDSPSSPDAVISHADAVQDDTAYAPEPSAPANEPVEETGLLLRGGSVVPAQPPATPTPVHSAQVNHPGTPAQPSAAATTEKAPAAMPSLDAPADPNESDSDKGRRAIDVLRAHGVFGEALLRALHAIWAAGDARNPSEVFFKKARVMLVRWPEAISLSTPDKRPVIEALRAHPEYLAESYLGAPIDVARNGVTITVPVRAGTWNAVPLSEQLSGAVNFLIAHLDAMSQMDGA